LDAISAATWVDIIHIDHGLHRAATEVLRIHQDKRWSLVDCSSIVVMKSLGITAALTNDHHFEQAGLTRLLQVH
jgi:predicted nucleic acid-binding protein